MNDLINKLPPVLQNEIAIFVMIALGLTIIGFLVVWLFREIRGRPDVQRQQTFASLEDDVPRGSAGTTRTMDSSGSGILGRLSSGSRTDPNTGASAPLLSSLTSGTEIESRDQAQIEPELRQAGFYRPTALAEYKSVRAILVLLPLIAAATLALLIDPVRVPTVVMGGVVLAVLGYSVPRLYINSVARHRKREIERGLPVATDMLVLGLLSGQNVMNSFARVAHEVRRAYPILSEEMQLAYRQAELNTLGHALRVWAVRSGVQEVYNLSVILSQSERQGIDITNSLLEFSQNYRTTLRQRADAQANRASFWMLFPTVLCMWIPAAVILAAPVYFEFDERRTKAREAMMPPGSDPTGTLQQRYEGFLKGQTPP